MSDWAEDYAAATATAEETQAAEVLAEGRFDVVHDKAQAEGNKVHALMTDEFREWMAARQATDAAWGVWSTVMDAKPQA